MQSFDVLIVGAGISGIGAAYHLTDKCPNKTYAILEARSAMGGTWDLFRYPGIRSDSDMHTLGYNFKPWTQAKAIADGPSIRKYVNETAAENDIARHIQYNQKVTAAAWDSDSSRWTVTTSQEGEEQQYSCQFLMMCAGYYNYTDPFTPEFEGMDDFTGTVIHPQLWPEDLDYTNKKVVIIGSGATAMTLVPAMADKAAHVTMVQRSPTYVVSRPAQDVIANTLRKFLPDAWAYNITRFKNTRLQAYMYNQTRTNPAKVKERLLGFVRKALGPDYDVDTHFTPSYNPWDQRLCLIPDGDLYKSINAGDASVVTGTIERVTESGLKMTSGEEVSADILITATGLTLELLGGADFTVDGETVDFPHTYTYKGMMYSDVPNLIQTFGYVNASWTLRADLTSEYACRVLNHMDELGVDVVTPRLREEDRTMETGDWIEDFSAGYMRRVMHLFPKQGSRDPWRNTQNYYLDKKLVHTAALEDGALIFGPSQCAVRVPDDVAAELEAQAPAVSAG